MHVGRTTWCAVAALVALELLAFDRLAWAAGGAPRAKPPVFDKITNEVFFPDVREKLSGARPAKAAPLARESSSPTAASDSAAPSASRWDVLITPEAIDDEIKAQQSALTEALRTSAVFKSGGYQRARTSFSVLAAMFAIAAEHGTPTRWRRAAPAMRDLMARGGFNCKAGSDATYKDARQRAETLAGLLGGEVPKLPAAKEQPAWPKLADRTQLMKRLEAAQQAFGPGVAGDAELARQRERLLREAQVVSALTEVSLADGYEHAEDETFQQYAHDLQSKVNWLRDAVERKDTRQALKAVAEINKSCATCHEAYRN